MTDQLATLVVQLKERRASTLFEKIKLLDIRDDIWRKYIELSKGSSVDAALAQRTGLCPDMCCERERLTRELKRLFKSYEIDPESKTLDHALMVTEYSRASADQAMPSPYDLRSGPVLLQTMNYLITNIMDRFDAERDKSDWYNFLWDRLRAIRKEITQQHLRDQIAIEILEQCARFHIFCSAFLSEYTLDLFDPNLNNNVLIDCLNQLRDCYITHKRMNNFEPLGNIAEFCSYMLLINLKEDNETLLRIRHLCQDLTETDEMSTALDIHRALLLSNTTQFFRLIQNRASLLQSCLLHRYFGLIRSKRLDALILSARANDEFRLTDLTDVLGMDNDDETRDYLEQSGFSITTTTPPCLIIPSPENKPQLQSTIKLSQKLVISKYDGKLKDIITGREDASVVLADTNIEESFDTQGYFIGKMPNVDDVLGGTSTIVSEKKKLPAAPPSQAPQISAKPPGFPKRPSESALRSMAATTTTNTFIVRSRLTPSDKTLFSDATPSTTTTSSFRLSGFPPNQVAMAPTTASSLFMQQSIVSFNSTSHFQSNSIFPPATRPNFSFQRPSIISAERLVPSVRPTTTPIISRTAFTTPTKEPATPMSRPIDVNSFRPQPSSPISRRLSPASMDHFVEEFFDNILDVLIQEVTGDSFDESISQWNSIVSNTISIYDELLVEEIHSTIDDYCAHIQFRQKMLHDTLDEQNERQRRKYLLTKYFSLWLVNYRHACEERHVLNELQTKFKFANNEQLLELLTGIELIAVHEQTIEQAALILKTRRHIKRARIESIHVSANLLFEELLSNEIRSTIVESCDEYVLRQKLLDNALQLQNIRRRHHYLTSKYFSLWLFNFHRRRQQQRAAVVSKRTNSSFQMRSNKKLKENSDHEQQRYKMIRTSFDQIATDLKELQQFVNKLCS